MKKLFERAENGTFRSHRDLHIILDALPVALSWASLADGTIQFVNRTFTRTFGYPEGHFSTVHQWVEETYIVEAQRTDAFAGWNAMWASDTVGTDEVDSMELHVLCCDGSALTVLHRGIILHDIGIGIATFEDISDRKRAEDALRRLALEDPLTELANRRALHDHWRSAIDSLQSRPEAIMAVILVDLDGFKPVNDRFGHETGDEMLRLVAARLIGSVRERDMVGRVGGDEFVILLSDLKNTEQAAKICKRISDAFSAPFPLNGEPIEIGASVGMSVYPHDGGDLTSLMRHADEALYRRKRAGRGGWEWFTPPAV